MFLEFSDWTKFHIELVKLVDVFKKNSYNENFINGYFNNKYFLMTNILKNLTLFKKPLFLVLPYLELSSIQVTTKLTIFHLELVKLIDVFKKS